MSDPCADTRLRLRRMATRLGLCVTELEYLLTTVQEHPFTRRRAIQEAEAMAESLGPTAGWGLRALAARWQQDEQEDQ